MKIDYLKRVLNYCPDTGVFRWLENRSKSAKIGSLAGSKDLEGYICIMIDGKSYRANRLAYFYMTGFWPDVADHINRIRDDNRWLNIRNCQQHQNCCNTKLSIKNTSGVKGVSYRKDTGKWRSYVTIKNKKIMLGSFDEFNTAASVSYFARKYLHGEFTSMKESDLPPTCRAEMLRRIEGLK